MVGSARTRIGSQSVAAAHAGRERPGVVIVAALTGVQVRALRVAWQRLANDLRSERARAAVIAGAAELPWRQAQRATTTERRTGLIMDGMNSMMGGFMALMMGYWAVLLLVLLVVLVLAAVWLFEQIRRGAPAPHRTDGHPPENRP